LEKRIPSKWAKSSLRKGGMVDALRRVCQKFGHLALGVSGQQKQDKGCSFRGAKDGKTEAKKKKRGGIDKKR